MAGIESASAAANSGRVVGGDGQRSGDVSESGQPIATNTPTPAVMAAAAPSESGIPFEFLDTRLQDSIRSFQTASNRVNRSTMATDVLKLADAGVAKPQIASALGYLYHEDNSVDVKTDILGALGDLDDPSAFDQIVPGLGPHQPDEIHQAAIEALDSLGDKRAIPLIQPFLTDRDEDVREAAQSALDSLTDQ